MNNDNLIVKTNHLDRRLLTLHNKYHVFETKKKFCRE